jgi:hypothetical protein
MPPMKTKTIAQIKQELDRRLLADFAGTTGILECEPKLSDQEGVFKLRAKIYLSDKKKNCEPPRLRCERSGEFRILEMTPLRGTDSEFEAAVPASLFKSGFDGARFVLYSSPDDRPLATCPVWVVDRETIERVRREMIEERTGKFGPRQS